MDITKHKVQELQEQNKEYRSVLKKIRNMMNYGDLGIHRGKTLLEDILDNAHVY